MMKTLTVSIISAAALASGGLAYAKAPAKQATATHTKTTTKVSADQAGGRMVAAKTSTGKSVTYNCAKAGNANKAACKK